MIKNHHRVNRGLKTLALLAAMVCVRQAGAAEITGNISVGSGWSDNVGRLAQSPIEDTLLFTGFQLDASGDSRRLSFDLRSQFDFIHYVDDTVDDELVGGLVASADLTLVEEALFWVATENFGQQLTNPLGAANPNNRQDVNFFSTGPSLRLRPGSRNLVDLDLRYSTVSFEQQPTDNQRASANLSVGRELRRGKTLTLNAVVDRVEFDQDNLFAPFERHDAFLRYEIRGSSNTLGLSVGYSEIEFAGRESDGELVEVSWTKELGAVSSLQLSAGRRFSDQGNIFRFMQGGASDIRDTAAVGVSSTPFRNDYLNVQLQLDNDKTSVDLRALYNEEDFDGASLLDRKVTGFTGELRRNLTRQFFAGINARFTSRDFSQLDRKDDDLIVGLDFGLNFGPYTDVSVRLERFDRSSSLAGADIEEDRVLLRLTYVPDFLR